MSSLSQTHNIINKTANSAEKTGTASHNACSSFAIQNCGVALDNCGVPLENSDLALENCDLALENCGLPLRRFALIDMGSNSFRLCIFDDFPCGKNKKIKFVETCRLGEGFHDTLTIQPVPMARALSACEKFLGICKQYDIKNIFCFATAVVRESSNRDIFISACENLGLKIHILSGKQEALCGFLGGCKIGSEIANSSDVETSDIDTSDIETSVVPTSDTQTSDIEISENTTSKEVGAVAVFDIGGASFEIAVGCLKNFKGLFFASRNLPSFEDILEKSCGLNCGLSTFPLSFSHSFKLGAVRLTDLFAEDFESMHDHILQQFILLEKTSPVPIDFKSATCVGIGGTITSICGLIASLENFNPKLHGKVCSQAEIFEKVEKIKNMGKSERKNLPYLKDKRKEIIAAGGEILASALIHFSAQNITASLSDNLEGYREYLGI